MRLPPNHRTWYLKRNFRAEESEWRVLSCLWPRLYKCLLVWQDVLVCSIHGGSVKSCMAFFFFFFRRYQNLRVNKHNNSVVLISLRAYLYKCGNPKHLSIFLCVLNEVNELLFKACSCETVTGLFYNRMESVSCYMTWLFICTLAETKYELDWLYEWL